MKSNHAQSYYYKIFYQNELYKFIEYLKKNDLYSYNALSANNFYGSWENSIDGFHITPVVPNDNQVHVVTDSFRIIGNPRDEQKYFGSQTTNQCCTYKTINKKMEEIRNSPDWYKQIINKSKTNNISVEDQLCKDALWIMKESLKNGKNNNRWKRNPRVGNYSFILTVTTEDNLNKIPESIKSIGKTAINGQYINPYYDFIL